MVDTLDTGVLPPGIKADMSEPDQSAAAEARAAKRRQIIATVFFVVWVAVFVLLIVFWDEVNFNVRLLQRGYYVFEGHGGPVFSACFSPNGRFVLTGSADTTAMLWDASSGEKSRAFKGHSDYVNSACFSPHGCFVLTGSSDDTAILWDAASGARSKTFEGHTGVVISACFSPSGRYVLTASEDGTARLWLLPRKFRPKHR